MNTRSIARALLAGIFIAGGWDSLQWPDAKKGVAEAVGVPLAEKMGFDADAVTLVRINGATQLIGGIFLVAGWLPRVAALVLGGSLVPTTLGAHRFWEIDDPDRRRRQLFQALKNASILGGLVMAALDHGGRPSVFWKTRKAIAGAGSYVANEVDRLTG